MREQAELEALIRKEQIGCQLFVLRENVATHLERRPVLTPDLPPEPPSEVLPPPERERA